MQDDPDVNAMRVPVDPRVPLALERTFLAWLRTSLALMGFGFVVARFGLFLRELERVRGGVVPASRGISSFMGTTLVALGICAAAWAAIRFRHGLAAAAAGKPPLDRMAVVPTLIAVAMCGIGVATIWYFLMA
jgi:putative membrane protein